MFSLTQTFTAIFLNAVWDPIITHQTFSLFLDLFHECFFSIWWWFWARVSCHTNFAALSAWDSSVQWLLYIFVECFMDSNNMWCGMLGYNTVSKNTAVSASKNARVWSAQVWTKVRVCEQWELLWCHKYEWMSAGWRVLLEEWRSGGVDPNLKSASPALVQYKLSFYYYQ